MARKVRVFVESASNYVRVLEYNDTDGEQVSDKITGLGEWTASTQGGGTAIVGANVMCILESGEFRTGAFTFSDLNSVEVDGNEYVGSGPGFDDLLDFLTTISPTMFTGGDSANPLPTGAATSAKQDTGNTSLSSIDTKLSNQATAAKQDETRDRLGALSSPASGSVNANLQALKNDYAGQFIDAASGTELLFGFFTRSNTTGAATGMTFIKQSDLTPFVPASGVTSYETEMLSYLSQSRDLLTDIKTAVEALAATIDTGRILVTDQHP